MRHLFSFIILLFVGFSFEVATADLSREALKILPIQNGGRIKPFDTFAQESLMLLHGKRSKEGKAATDIVLTMYILPDMWADMKFLVVKNFEVKRDLGFAKEESYFSYNELAHNSQLPLLLQKLRDKEQTKEKLNPYDQAVQKIESQLYLMQAITSGMAFTFVPPKPEKNTTSWVPIPMAEADLRHKFTELATEFVQTLSAEIKKVDAPKFDDKELEKKVQQFMAAAQAQNPSLYPQTQDMKIEVFYNSMHPFRWAWVCYLVAALLGALSLMSSRLTWSLRAEWIFLGLGFLYHLVGFLLRVYISGRPPVSNMYETVIWVAFGAILFSIFIERVTRHKFVLVGGSVTAVFCLILADIAPTILDPSLQPLEPVLRSNFWLIVHVMTITISYSAFFLALALGNMGLYFFIRGENQYKTQIQNITQAIYRALQFGVVLLAAGIILGGVWADYSWGRFWGWDPKETWALIALLGYLAILHARMAGWLTNLGMNACSVICFSLIIMAWYGVNFVLGAGLHTYGFGAGGIEYVLGFVFVQILYVVYATLARKKVKA